MGLPGFNVSDLQQGSVSSVVYCLWSLKDYLLFDLGEDKDMNPPVKSVGEARMSWKALETIRTDPLGALRGDGILNGQNSVVLGEERRHSFQGSRLQHVLPSSVMSGKQLKLLTDAAENYHTVLAENRRLYNEVQELKGNIRVYCRIRPFLPGENVKQTTIEYIGDNGELLIANPSKQGKDVQRMFKFNKVFGPAASQDIVARKDEEIEQLQQLKDIRLRHNSNSLRHSSSSPCDITLLGGTIQQEHKSFNGGVVANDKLGSDHENFSEQSGDHPESGSQQSADDRRHQKEILGQSKLIKVVADQSSADPEHLGHGDADSEARISDLSDGDLSMGTETDGSIGSLVEFNRLSEQVKSLEITKEKVSVSQKSCMHFL
ncbi:hypothetical protein BHM03_00028858 [Ensete ventricosum]|nr:hypothetical protein BHM03_00028858 [Ensete ventricosum]